MSLNLNNTAQSDMTNVIEDAVVYAMNTDGVSGLNETEYVHTDWAQNWGYFNQVAALQSALKMRAIWDTGKGYIPQDTPTQVILDHVSGWGKDTFDDILFNLNLTSYICGDAFAEIVKDEDSGILVNIKPLDPSTIKIIVDKNGIIKEYKQMSKTPKGKEKVFQPEEIFHICNDRIADQVHGLSVIPALEPIILADKEIFDDTKQIMHHQAKPFILWKLKTDDQTKINNFVAKIDAARKLGEDTFIPDDDDAVKYEVIQLNPSALIFEWINATNNKFYNALGMPQLLFGKAGSGESGSKMEMFAHEQVFEQRQRYLEKQIYNQLNLKINLIPPTSLLNDLQSDQAKDGAGQRLGMQPNELTAGSGA